MGMVSSQTPGITQAGPAMSKTKIGSAGSNAPKAIELIGLSKKKTLT
jgi:hypothetical protein